MTVINVKGQSYHIVDAVLQQLSVPKAKVVKNNDMFVALFDGRTGSGKTTLAMQLAYWITDGNFSLDDVCFTPQKFAEKLNNIHEGGCIVLDEAFDSLNRRTSLSRENMEVLSKMQKMRLKKCFIFIILPSFYDLDKNVILNLAEVLFHCYRKPFGTRGQYFVYKRAVMKSLWLNCRQFYTYNPKKYPPTIRHARFSSHFPLDMDEYDRLKAESLKDNFGKVSRTDKKYIEQRDALIAYMTDKLKMESPEVAEIAGISAAAVRQVIKRHRDRVADPSVSDIIRASGRGTKPAGVLVDDPGLP